MSDIFQEVDEEVRRDKAAEFWKKYQNQILAAAVLIVLAAAGFRYWQYERERATEAAGDQFQQALTALEGGKLDEAKAGLDKIAAQGPSGYRALAQMTAAGAEAAKDPQGAIGAFDAAAGDADHVVAAHLYDAACCGLAPRHVDVGGQHSSSRPHAVCQAPQYRDAARTHLPAPPPFPEPEVVEMAEGPRIEQFGERREPFARLLAAVVKQVPVHSNIMVRPVRRGYEP